MGMLVPSDDTAKPTWARKGEYDRIVCAGCEGSFAAHDQYGWDALAGRLWNPRPCFDHGRLVCFELWGLEPHALKLFCLSILWRVAASDRSFSALVDLGEREADLATILRTGARPGPEAFSVTLARFIGEGGLDPARIPVLSPHTKEFDGVQYAWIYLGEVMMSIKIADVASPERFRVTQLSAAPVRVLARPFRGSPEHDLILSMIDGLDHKLPTSFLAAAQKSNRRRELS